MKFDEMNHKGHKGHEGRKEERRRRKLCVIFLCGVSLYVRL